MDKLLKIGWSAERLNTFQVSLPLPASLSDSFFSTITVTADHCSSSITALMPQQLVAHPTPLP
jgi:hypothetical protein